jgi:hypothetical protein
MSAPVKQSSSWLSVYDGTSCVGRVGLFPTLPEAAGALEDGR